MSMVSEQWAFLQDVAKLLAFISDNTELLATAGEMWRTSEQQRIYMRNGRSKTMHSQHLKRLAIDLNFFDKNDTSEVVPGNDPRIKEIGDYWESLSEENEWGGNWSSFKDYPHFQRTA